MKNALMHRLVSIHDVMPSTLEFTDQLLDLCRQAGIERLTLLVVPGLPWTRSQVDRLKSWFDQGHELAGHGWVHQAAAIRNWRHRWHSRLVSRRAAEHLCLDDTEIADLLQRCFAWFPQHDLPEPSLYVPPAWALGPISRETLRRSPFALIESTGGVTWTSTGKHRWLPLVGFEADTELRRWALRCWNRANQAAAGRVVRAAPDQEPREHSPLRPQPGGRTRPLRIAIHPHDHRLRLRKDLQRLLEQPGRSRCYRDLLTDARQRACDVIAPASRT